MAIKASIHSTRKRKRGGKKDERGRKGGHRAKTRTNEYSHPQQNRHLTKSLTPSLLSVSLSRSRSFSCRVLFAHACASGIFAFAFVFPSDVAGPFFSLFRHRIRIFRCDVDNHNHHKSKRQQRDGGREPAHSLICTCVESETT